MIKRKSWFILLIGIAAFTAVYLYYVKKERKESIARYLPDPKAGDIYKMERRTAHEGRETFYLLVKDVTEKNVFFYQGRQTASYGANDIFLKSFDSSDVIHYSKKELEQISTGQWDSDDHDHTTLFEISRK